MAKRIYLGREVSKYAEIAGGAIVTLTALFFVLMVLGFEITGSDDICLGTPNDPCISYGKICNLGPDNYDIYNPNGFKLDFSPTIKDYWIFFKDGRVKKQFLYDIGINHSTKGWRYENFTDATKPRKDRVYVHRFARYSCQEYMLVGLKENPDDFIKWGVGVGTEYLDPYWYGINDTANISVSNNITLELNSQINITTNLSGASTVCVDIDHPSYGNEYVCGSPNANFLFNISYFRKNELNNTNTTQNLTYASKGNQTVWIKGHQYDEVVNLTINLSGYLNGATYPENVKIYINGSLSNSLGPLRPSGSDIFIGSFNETSIESTVSNYYIKTNQTIINYFKLPKGANVTYAKFNFTGLTNWTGSSFYGQIADSEGNDCTEEDCGDIGGSPADDQTKAYDSTNSTFAYSYSCGSDSGEYSVYYLNYTHNISNPSKTNWNILWDFDAYDSSAYRRQYTVSCWDYDTDSWDIFDTIMLYGGSPAYEKFWERDYEISNENLLGCLKESPLQLKTKFLKIGTGVYCSTIRVFELDTQSSTGRGLQWWNSTNYPQNLSIEVGSVDGTYEGNISGELNISNPGITNDFKSNINSYLDSCTADLNGYCYVPVYLTSDGEGKIKISNINITYTYDNNPIQLDNDLVQSFLGNSTNYADIPIMIYSNTSGIVEIKDIRYDYAGGNDTIEVLVYEYNLSLNILNDSTSSGSLYFNGNENITKFISINKSANIISAFINFSGNNETYYFNATGATSTVNIDGATDGNWSTATGFGRGRFEIYHNVSWSQGISPKNISIAIKTYTYGPNADSIMDCKNSSGSWIRVGTLTDGEVIEYHTIGNGNADDCLNNTKLELNIEIDQVIYASWAYLYEWNYTFNYDTINNPFLEIGNPDGIYEWNFVGEFNESNSPNKTNDLKSSLNSAINGGICDCINCSIEGDNCLIPLIIHSDTEGKLKYSSIDILYENKGNNDTLNIINYYSNWNYNFPSYVDWLEFIPRNPTSKNVTPYGQTNSRPILNITNYGYGGINANFFSYLNETHSCVDLFMSTNSTKPTSSLWDGLVSYWSFDIDARDNIGDNDGTVSGATNVDGEEQDGLVSWWKFDADGDLQDYEGDHPVDINNTVWNSNGILKGNYQFNGINSSMDMSSNDWKTIINESSGYTMSAWIYINSSHKGSIVCQELGNYMCWFLSTNNRMYYSWDDIRDSGTPSSVLDYNKWVHVGVVIQNTSTPINWTFYINGVKDTSGALNDPSGAGDSSSSELYIGKNDRSDTQGTSTFFNGSIDGVRIYDKILSESEMLALYERRLETMGNAYEFDGVEDYITIPYSDSLNITGNNFSISMWVKWQNNSNDNSNGLIMHQFSYAGQLGFFCRSSSPSASVGCYSGSEYDGSASGFFIEGTWVNFVVTYNGTLNYFRNGIFNSSYVHDNHAGGNKETKIGTETSANNEFNGSIDEVRIYNRSLTSTEITELYDRSRNKYYDVKFKDNWLLSYFNRPYLFNENLWMWADYDCNYTTWNLWEPEFSFRNCCEDCICSEEI